MLETGGGEFLPESNAILFYFYLAEGTTLLPEERFGRARLAVDVLQHKFLNFTERLS